MNDSLDFSAGLSALAAVQRHMPSAVLAGGYVRDIVLGREPKDIDIFVTQEDEDRWASNGLRGLNADMMYGVAYMPASEVSTVWNVRGFALPVQVIVMAAGVEPLDRIEQHDFGFCQCWLDPAGWWIGTDAFHQDAMAATATLVHCEDELQYARSMRRWDRLKEKYPDFRLVVPEQFQWFAK